MPAGRPSEYNSSFVDKVAEYIATTGREQTSLPTMEGFSIYLGVDTDTLVDWSKKYPEFSVAIKQLKEYQKQQLMDDGMYGGKDVNSSMAIFLLKANHGMIETERRMLVGEKGAEPVQVVSYGNTDPLSVFAHSSNAASVGRSTSLPSAQLAPESAEDNTSS